MSADKTALLHRWAALCVTASTIAVVVVAFALFSFMRFKSVLGCSLNQLLMVVAVFDLLTGVVMGTSAALVLTDNMTHSVCRALGSLVVVISCATLATAFFYWHIIVVLRTGETSASRYIPLYIVLAISCPTIIIVVVAARDEVAQNMAWCFVSSKHVALQFFATYFFACCLLVTTVTSFWYLTKRKTLVGVARYRVFLVRYSYAAMALLLWLAFGIARFDHVPKSSPMMSIMAFFAPLLGAVNSIVFIWTEDILGLYLKRGTPKLSLAKTCSDWSYVLEGEAVMSAGISGMSGERSLLGDGGNAKEYSSMETHSTACDPISHLGK